jgi:hypothetical protein
MYNWRECMPAGMHLKSDGFASDLYDSERRVTLKSYCAQQGIVYDDLKIPVLLENFIQYGLAFQAQLVPNLEPQRVVSVKRAGDQFELQVETGEKIRAERVVVATGISHIGHVPSELAGLDAAVCTHSSAHHDLTKFKGKKVVVVGGGASAIDIAALLHAAGASTDLVSRHPVSFSEPPGEKPRPLWQRLRHPHFGLGSSFRSTIYTLFPNLFHYLPRSLRLRIVKRHLGPFGGWFVRPKIEGLVPMHQGYSLKQARAVGAGVELTCVNQQGQPLKLTCDHVIAATGYRTDIHRLPFLDRSLAAQIEVEAQSPVLSNQFESSVRGLYFMGVLAANSFGPLLRFALGARFCAGRLARHLARVAPRSSPEVSIVPARQTD